MAQPVPHWDAPGSWYRVQKWEQNWQVPFFLLLTFYFFSFQSHSLSPVQSTDELHGIVSEDQDSKLSTGQYSPRDLTPLAQSVLQNFAFLCHPETFSGFVSFFRPIDFNPGCTLEFHEEFIFLIPVWASSQSSLPRITHGGKHQFTSKLLRYEAFLGNHHL